MGTARSNERHLFLVDLLVTFVEGGPYSWFRVNNYKIDKPGTPGYRPGFEGAIGANACARLNAEDPNGGEGWLGWRNLTVETFARGLGRLKQPIEGLHEDYRKRILKEASQNDAGNLDINDVDIIVQAAIYGEIVFA